MAHSCPLAIGYAVGMDTDAFSKTFYAELAQPAACEALLDNLFNLTFYVKNHLGQYVSVNQTLVDRSGKTN